MEESTGNYIGHMAFLRSFAHAQRLDLQVLVAHANHIVIECDSLECRSEKHTQHQTEAKNFKLLWLRRDVTLFMPCVTFVITFSVGCGGVRDEMVQDEPEIGKVRPVTPLTPQRIDTITNAISALKELEDHCQEEIHACMRKRFTFSVFQSFSVIGTLRRLFDHRLQK